MKDRDELITNDTNFLIQETFINPKLRDSKGDSMPTKKRKFGKLLVELQMQQDRFMPWSQVRHRFFFLQLGIEDLISPIFYSSCTFESQVDKV